MPRRDDLRHILVIGSGPIVIGRPCEFDYSGTQACRVLREEGIRVSLVDSNPATIMTDPEFADATYIEPITAEFVEKGHVAGTPGRRAGDPMGLLTALNTAIALHENGVLAALRRRADRRRHRRDPARRGPAEVQGDRAGRRRRRAAQRRLPLDGRGARRRRRAGPARGDPPVVHDGRPGLGHGAHRATTWIASPAAGSPRRRCTRCSSRSRVLGWKEYELELMRDRRDNVVVVCSIENLDPMGVHTGDSITVAPAMTLTDREYQHMRDVGIDGAARGRRRHRRLQHPVRGAPRDRPAGRHRDEPARVAVVGAGVEGHRLPDREDRGEAGRRLHPRRDPQRHHRRDPGGVRADAGLRRGQGPAVRVREVPRRGPRADHHDEERRRGDGARPLVRRGAGQGAALDGRPAGAGSGSRPTRPTPRSSRRAPAPTGGSTPSSGRCGDGASVAELAAAHRDRPVVPRPDRRRSTELRTEIDDAPPCSTRGAAAPGQACGTLRPPARRAAPGARRRGRGARAARTGSASGRSTRPSTPAPPSSPRARRTTTAPTRPTPQPSRRSRRSPTGPRC